jgi:hypothetical protein
MAMNASSGYPRVKHHCHAMGCRTACPPRHLVCGKHWAMVPADLQKLVYRCAAQRDGSAIDASWAPWWRAQARAIHAVLDRVLLREMAFSMRLEEA